MLLSLTGASGAGKSTVLDRLRALGSDPLRRCVEFDSIGVPDGADTAWRHGAIEWWVQEALKLQEGGIHLLLCGQVPMGELLASPSAGRLDGVAVCLLHCSADVRRERLLSRGEDPEAIEHHARFGEWFLHHTRDPRYAPEVIQVAGDDAMEWNRWVGRASEEMGWRATIIDTDVLSVDESAVQVARWVREALDGKHTVG